MKSETETLINDIFERTKKNLIEDINTAGEPVLQLFEVLMKILIAQEQEYSKLFETSGFLPKQYEKPVAKLFVNFFEDEKLFAHNNIQQVETLLEHATALTSAFMGKPPVFIQQVLTVNDKKETNYTIENFTYEWAPDKSFFPGTKLRFPSLKIEAESNAQLRVRRIPLSHNLLIDILMKFLNDDNWEIQETDMIEHYQEQVFQWDKAFGPMFENAQ